MGRAKKLKSKWDFERVFARGKTIKDENIVIYSSPGKTQDIRVGICVGKALGSAVTRNRLKRQIREVIRNMDFVNYGYDIVIVARKKLVGSDFSSIKGSVHRLLSRIQMV